MNIHQIQMMYDKLQDRILLRVSTSEQAEFRFWVTRRYIKLLWSVLLKMLERDPVAAVHLDEQVRRSMMEFQHVDAVSAGEFAKPYEEAAKVLPLGGEPVLLSRITARQNAGTQPVLCLHPEQGQGIDIAVDAKLLHMISKLVADAVAQSDWALRLALDPRAASVPAAQAVPAHKLN